MTSLMFVFLLASAINFSSGWVVPAVEYPNLVVPAEQWSELAFDFISNMSCQNTFISTEEDCEKLVSLPKSAMNFYSADPVPGKRYKVVLHDGPLTRHDSHDAVLVVDPYPEANLGHLLVVFFVDFEWTELECNKHGGKYSAEYGCISLALRKRCHNLQQNGMWKAEYLRQKHCEINFFPLVHFSDEEPSQKLQKLECKDLISGYGPCPLLRPPSQTNTLYCDALEENTYSCNTIVGSRCRIFERCDHAVLLSGGFDRLTDSPRYLENMLRFHEMLKINGFPHMNVKMFYSNGNQDIDENLGIKDEVHPSSAKLAIRYHLRRICQTYHCADSLVIYLNSPTRNDGASLLWDVDKNGQIDENEVYTIHELLVDTQDCNAQQVYIIADQNFSGKIVTALEHSKRHQNVMAFVSGGEHEYSWAADYSKLWTTYDHNQDCVRDIHESFRKDMNSSQPIFYDGTLGTLNTTIYGAPCDVMPPFSDYELERRYYGCQNLPTSIWLRRGRANTRFDD